MFIVFEHANDILNSMEVVSSPNSFVCEIAIFKGYTYNIIYIYIYIYIYIIATIQILKWNLNILHSLENYNSKYSNVSHFIKFWFILNSIHSFKVWNQIFKLSHHFELMCWYCEAPLPPQQSSKPSQVAGMVFDCFG
jgi:hypothetical protein